MHNRVRVFQPPRALYLEKIFLICLWGIAFFLSGGVVVKGVPLPFVLAMSYFLLKEERWQNYLLLGVMVLGSLWSFGLGPLFFTYFFVVLITLVLSLLMVQARYKVFIIVFQFTALICLRLFVFPLVEESSFKYILLFCELLLLLLFYFLLKEFYEEETFALPLALLLLAIGMVNSLDPLGGILLPISFVLILGRMAEHNLALFLGLAIGILRSITGTGALFEMGYLPLLGFLSSRLPDYSPSLYFISIAGATIIFTNFMNYPDLASYLILFSLVGICSWLVLYLPGKVFSLGQKKTVVENQMSEKLNNNLNYKFNALAGVFTMLAQIFQESSAGERGLGEEFIKEFILTVSQGVCRGCPKHNKCWQEGYAHTCHSFYKIFTRFAQYREVDSLKLREAFDVSCIDWHRLSVVLKQGLDAYRLHHYWQREFFEQQDLWSQQMEEMGEIILNLGQELQDTQQSQKEREASFKQALLEGNYKAVDLKISQKRRNYEIKVEMKPCGGQSHCRTHILSILRATFGSPLSLYVKKCGFVSHGHCQLVFTPKNMYKVGVGIAAVSSSNDKTSGDRFFFNELANGQFVAIISDGMGTGYSAARESSAAVNLLDKILNAGFSYDIAIRAINTVLNLRSKGEKYATIDMAIIDTYCGRCNGVKVGAAPSLLRHLQEVFVLEGDTPPAGVLKQINTSSHEHYLDVGDILVLLSDGAYAGCDDLQKMLKRELLSSTLPKAPQAKAEYLLSLIKRRQVRLADDITILLLEIEKRT